jgi:hypothetical protein
MVALLNSALVMQQPSARQWMSDDELATIAARAKLTVVN